MLPVGSADVDLAGGHVSYHASRGGPERATRLVVTGNTGAVTDDADTIHPERLPVLYQALSTTVVVLTPFEHPSAFEKLTVGDRLVLCDAECFKATGMMPAVSVPRIVVNAGSTYAADSAVCFAHNIS